MTRDPTLIGTVEDVTGEHVSIALTPETAAGLSFVDGHGYRIGQVGSFIRVPIGYLNLFGIVSQVGAGAIPERLQAQEPLGRRWMTIQLLGETDATGTFQRGVSQYPTIGDRAHLVAERDLAKIYGRPDDPRFVRVGAVASADALPSLIDINRLINRHAAVVGATGAGKSTTIAALLRALTDNDRFPSARVLLLDMHGEYATALRDRATLFQVNPPPGSTAQRLFIPYWALTYDELLPLTFGALDDNSRTHVLERITELKAASLLQTPRDGVTRDNLTVDSPVPFSIHQLWFDLHAFLNATHTVQQTAQSRATFAYELGTDGKPLQPGDPLRVIPPRTRPQSQAAGAGKIYLSGATINCRRETEHLAGRLRDPRLNFLFRPGDWVPDLNGQPARDLHELLARWLGGQQPITILDLSGIPVSVVTHLIGALLRLTYDALFWARHLPEGGRQRPLLVVLEEAHLYLGAGDTSTAASAVRRIVKEGRKYGVGALIVSQRPAEIDQTVLSQCGTIFAMRLSNPTDRGHVTGATTDNLEGLFATLPSLRTGEVIITGEAVQLPVRTLVDAPPIGRRPDSQDPLIYDPKKESGWNVEPPTPNYEEVVRAWRRQDPSPPERSKP